jgi:hypothetical protein
MSLETFRKIVDKMPPTLTQIAFGITGVRTNPDLLRMMQYARSKDIAPNVTLTGADLDEEFLREFVKVGGACAVSVYETNPDLGFDTVKRLTDAGMKQVNVHLMTSAETFPFVWNVVRRIAAKTDPRLAGLRAAVFLRVKPKGRAKGAFSQPSHAEFRELVMFCLQNDVPFGFDSCSAPYFTKAMDEIRGVPADLRERIDQMIEPCESSLFSAYINVRGEYWNCSFCEGEHTVTPVDVLAADNFLRDVWYSPQVSAFRKRLLTCGRTCPVHILSEKTPA